MIRTTMTALGLFVLTGATAMAATKTIHHQAKPALVAQADTATPAPASDGAKVQKKSTKKAKGSAKVSKASKDKSATTDGATVAPSSEKMPEKK